MALLALKAQKLIEDGLDVSAVCEEIEKIKLQPKANLIFEKLDYLYKGGRFNSLLYLGANLLKIRPMIYVKDGVLVAGKKYRGDIVKSVKNYCVDIFDVYKNPELDTAFVLYTTASQEMIDVAYNALKMRGFKEIYITRANGTITSHCGEHCIGIIYINKD